MYRIKNVKTGKFIMEQHMFLTYERARQAVRKLIRKQVANGKKMRGQFGLWDDISRNPSRFGHVYTIQMAKD